MRLTAVAVALLFDVRPAAASPTEPAGGQVGDDRSTRPARPSIDGVGASDQSETACASNGPALRDAPLDRLSSLGGASAPPPLPCPNHRAEWCSVLSFGFGEQRVVVVPAPEPGYARVVDDSVQTMPTVADTRPAAGSWSRWGGADGASASAAEEPVRSADVAPGERATRCPPTPVPVKRRPTRANGPGRTTTKRASHLSPSRH